MSAQRTVVAGVIAVVLIALGMTALVTLGNNDEGSSAADGASPSATDSSGAATAPGEQGTSDSDTSPGSGTPAASGQPSGQPSDQTSETPGGSATGGSGGSDDDQPLEVPSPTQPTEQALPGLTDGPDPDAPLLTEVPPEGFARGSLAAGYPRSVLPPVKKSKIITSAVSVDGKRATVTLTGRSSRSVDAILRFYRIRLGARAFAEEPATPAAGSSAAAFVRDRNTVAVTVTPRGKQRNYTVYAVLVVGS